MSFRRVFTTAIAITATPLLAARVSVWIAPWDAAALTSLQTNGGSMQESNPVWYSMDASGNIVPNWNAENSTWRAAMVGTDLLPTLQNMVSGSFNGTVAATLLSTAASRDSHAEAIRQLVVNKAFDGIDIDYERVPTTSRADFTSFIQTLGSKLHSSGKKLSVTVYAKTSDAQNWNGPGAEDWPAISAVADSVKIMAYDYHWATSAAGAITPLDWLDTVASYAESAIPASKIMMGLPWYGYDWQGTNGKGVVWTDAKATALNTGATITHDVNGEATYSYADHVVYFQDAASYQKKIDLLVQRHPAITGFAHWRSGNEDPDIWGVIRNLASGGAGTTTNPPGDFLVSGSSALSVTVGSSVTSAYGLVPVNNFNGDTTVTVSKVGSVPATLSLSASTIRPGQTTTLTVATNKRATAGTYQIVLHFVSGSLVHDQTVTVTISAVKRVRTLTH